MRILFICLLATVFFNSCSTQTPKTPDEPAELKLEADEDGEYDIIVFDTQYDLFLQTRAMPKDFYSEAYYKNRNTIFVNEWNMRVNQPMTFSRDLYEMRIDYNPRIDYGLNLEYKLFNFFLFIEWKYKVNLDNMPNRTR